MEGKIRTMTSFSPPVGEECVCSLEKSMGCVLGCPVVELGGVGSCPIHQHELHTTQGIIRM